MKLIGPSIFGILITLALAWPNNSHAIKLVQSSENNTGCVDPNIPKPQTVSLGRIDSRVIDVPKPIYPAEAKERKICGVVTAVVVVDEAGKVIWARVRDGHPLLQEGVKAVVCRARLKPFKVSGRFVRSNGIITYKFELP